MTTPSSQPTPTCRVTHYSLDVPCTQSPDHPGGWHTSRHPDTGRLLRFRTDLDARHTQEWQSADDPGDPEAGEWVTWHYIKQGETTSVVPADFDQRAASFVGCHFPTGQVRRGQAGAESRCACGDWYPAGREDLHLGREVSLLAHSYFDLALMYGAQSTNAS